MPKDQRDLVSPWFKLISKTLLAGWWEALERGETPQADPPSKIHRY